MNIHRFEETENPHYALHFLLVVVGLIFGTLIGIVAFFITHGEIPWL